MIWRQTRFRTARRRRRPRRASSPTRFLAVWLLIGVLAWAVATSGVLALHDGWLAVGGTAVAGMAIGKLLLFGTKGVW